MALTVARRFDVIVDALGRAEELGELDLASFAAEHGIAVETLKQVLEPVLYLEFRDAVGDLVDGTSAYLVTEDDRLVVSDEHWLGVARSTPPSPEHAVRLMIAGLIAQTALPAATNLDSALAKLAGVVSAPLVIEAARPRFTDLCERALAAKRTIRFTYYAESSARRAEHEIEPSFVGSNWGNWYLIGRPVDGDGVRTFRIDRIIRAEITDRACVPDSSVTLPDWWDLDDWRRTVRLRVDRRALDRIPTPVQIDVLEDTAEGDHKPGAQVLVDVTVFGDQRFADLLVMLGADADIVDHPDATRIRREQAARIRSLYGPA